MSYCRWSSDDYQCDVYVYESCGGGWQIHVAGRRRRLLDGVEFPPLVEDARENFNEWWDRHRVVHEMIDEANEGKLWAWQDLPESYAGESIRCASPAECADTLEEIRAAGFNVPQYAIDELREEQAAV